VDLTKYLAVRDQMGSGDMLEWSGKSVLDVLIRIKTGQDVNHTSLILNLESPASGPVLMNVEAMADGVEPHFLSTELSLYDGRVFWYKLKREFKNEIPVIESRMFFYAGRTGYAYCDLCHQLAGRTIIHEGEPLTTLFCSETAFVINGGTGEVPWPGEVNKFLNRWEDRIEL